MQLLLICDQYILGPKMEASGQRSKSLALIFLLGEFHVTLLYMPMHSGLLCATLVVIIYWMCLKKIENLEKKMYKFNRK